jgi:hypothetical protein
VSYLSQKSGFAFFKLCLTAQRQPIEQSEICWSCVWAAEGRHVEVWKYLHENGCPWDESTIFHKAEMAGHLKIMQWLAENWHNSCTIINIKREK